ncbi:MAG: pilus assembly protein N-terminal domain-containing protein [Pseudomonadota bacterium]
MKLRAARAAVVMAVALGIVPSANAQRMVRISVGQSETVSVSGAITKVQVLNPSVADVANYSSRNATIVGVGLGSTEILINTSRQRYKFVVTANVINIDYRPYGIRLNVNPTADGFGNVQAEILAEVSEPDRRVAVQNVPGFRTRRFKTSVAAKDGNSIVLNGLFTNSEEKAVSKFPLLGHIPIIGELFKSREFQEQKTTLVVFVTPKIVTPKHPWVRKTIQDIRKLYDDYEAEVGWQVFD